MPIDMQNELKKEISKYLKEIRKRLPGDKESKTEFIDGLTEQIEDFVAENEDATSHDILLTFGEPTEIADEYSAGIDAQEIKKSISIKKAIIIALVVAIVIWGLTMCFMATDAHFSYNGYYVDEVSLTEDVYEQN